MISDSIQHSEITEKIIKSFYDVYNKLGYGFLEKVYENAMAIELIKNGLSVEQQHKIDVYYNDEIIGEYFADILVENQVIIELKASKGINEAHECQLVNYLKASEIEVGLILNFGSRPSMKRKIFSNSALFR
ncbi:MAG: GxxExxY protein [Bacteroidota bacterium]